MIEVRVATIDDAQQLFAWRNDATTRRMSKNTDPVAWETHLAWLTDRLATPEPQLFIVEEHGIPVATYRIDGDGEISYTVSPGSRGRGIASALLEQAEKRHGPLTAKIFRDNHSSIKAAERAKIRIVYLDRSPSLKSDISEEI